MLIKIFLFLLIFKLILSLSVLPSINQNYPIATTTEINELRRESKGMLMDDYDLEDHDHHDEMMMKPIEPKAIAKDPWAAYYDFAINEGSFKFWAAFQLITAVLLIYSAFAAVYYAKFNVITSDYDYYDDFFGRSNNELSSNNNWSGLTSQTFQRIFDAISSKKYS